MQFELSDEQLDFQKSLRRMISDRSPIKAVREVIKTVAGCDEGLWQQFAERAGLPALLEPEGGIKHRLSETAVEVDTARAASWYAAYAGAQGRDDFQTAALVTKPTAAPGFASPYPGPCRSTVVSASPGIMTHGGPTARASPLSFCLDRPTPGSNWRTDSRSNRKSTRKTSAERGVTTRNRGIA